jgi:hypothetical protein
VVGYRIKRRRGGGFYDGFKKINIYSFCSNKSFLNCVDDNAFFMKVNSEEDIEK